MSHSQKEVFRNAVTKEWIQIINAMAAFYGNFSVECTFLGVLMDQKLDEYFMTPSLKLKSKLKKKLVLKLFEDVGRKFALLHGG